MHRFPSIKNRGVVAGAAMVAAGLLAGLRAPAAGAAPAAPTLALHRPELVAVRITGQTSLFNGMTAVYEAVVRNDGTRPPEAVEFRLSASGALETWQVVEEPTGFTCTTLANRVTCTGMLGGTADPIQTRVAVLRVRLHATEKGPGYATLLVDPQNRITEGDETAPSNRQLLQVTVR